MAEDLIAVLTGKFPSGLEVLSTAPGDEVVAVGGDSLLDVMSWLKGQPLDYVMLLDLTCVDERPLGRGFTMVYHLQSLSRNHRLRIKVFLPAESPAAPSLAGLWKNANWLEREVYDMFGVAFTGHPDLRRILMYDGFEGHPLRKDYPLRKRQPLVKERIPDA
jgi:NADH-quinone oxidoreductase subunit C